MNRSGSKVHWLYSNDSNCHHKFNAEFIESEIEDKSCTVYICGPPSFISDSLNIVEQIGVPTENVFYEYFGPMI